MVISANENKNGLIICGDLNHMRIKGKQFEGGITFQRAEQMSQNDWILCNRFQIHTVSMFYI